MNLIQATVTAALPPTKKNTPSGWISFNAVCCHHKGENRDKKKRGGVLMSPDGFQYHCFNCNFKAGWQPGKLLSKNTKDLLRWLGVSEDEINKCGIEALKNKEEITQAQIPKEYVIEARSLPEKSRSFEEWLELNHEHIDFLEAVKYVLDRKFELDWYDWHWTPLKGYRDRVIIPFYLEGKVVGYTARKITPGNPKYLTHVSPGYVFNIDAQTFDRKYVIVVEGQFDAIAVDGVAIGHNDPNSSQIMRINALGKEVIVVPDNDKPGAKLINAAIANDWSVSLPDWGEDVKDVADAVKKFGRNFTLFTILKHQEKNKIKIQLLKKKLENKNDR
jgi:hypothetical protein